jgi:hypothetical protein
MSPKLVFANPPESNDATQPSRTEVGDALSRRAGSWAIVGYHDRLARAEAQAVRINSGREYGDGHEAIVRQVGPVFRTYARKLA